MSHMIDETRRAEQERLLVYIPAAWRLTDAEFEELLEVSPGWLRAWRNHEVKPGDQVFERLLYLDTLQLAMEKTSTPDYAAWLRRVWNPDSQIGARSPLQAILEEGDVAIDRLKGICNAL